MSDLERLITVRAAGLSTLDQDLGRPIAPRNPQEPLTSEHHTQLRHRWPDTERLHAAFMLAGSLHTLEQLLQGQPVDQARLNQAALQDAAPLVRLTTRRERWHELGLTG